MISSGVLSSLRSGMVTRGAIAMTMRDEMNVMVMQHPIDFDSESRCLAPKYCDTMMPAPTEIPMNSTKSRFSIGPALPTAARALSPIYFPTTMLSTVLYSC